MTRASENKKYRAKGVFDIHGKLLEANDAMYHFLGTTKKENAPLYTITKPDLVSLPKNVENGTQVFEGIITISNFSEISFELNSQIVFENDCFIVWAEADVKGLFEMNKRMSRINQQVNNLQRELIREKKKLETANTKLQQLNFEMNKYLGMAAHDLRNPIGNAFAYTDLLISDYENIQKEDQISFLKIINKQCSYALTLIETFLDASKIEAGILDLNLNKHNFITIIRESIEQNRMFAEKKSQQIILEHDDDLMLVTCDREKMLQVVNNLISNAIKYSEPGKTILIKAKEHGDCLETRVIDQGPGIKKEEIGQIFNAYKTASTKSTAGEKSTGLGLSIVKKIIESHKGSLDVKSSINVGSEFSFSIPVQQTI